MPKRSSKTKAKPMDEAAVREINAKHEAWASLQQAFEQARTPLQRVLDGSADIEIAATGPKGRRVLSITITETRAQRRRRRRPGKR